MARIDALLSYLLQGGETLGLDPLSLHISSGQPPLLRLGQGPLTPLPDYGPLSNEDVHSLLLEIVPEESWVDLARPEGVTLRYQPAETQAALQLRVFRHGGGLGVTAQALSPLPPSALPTLAELHLVPVLASALTASQGLLLVSGPIGSGKSVTLAALSMGLAQGGVKHVVCLEERSLLPAQPLSSRDSGEVIIRQGIGEHNRLRSLEVALRLDPDVLVIDPLTPDLYQGALSAAASGIRVLASLCAKESAQALLMLGPSTKARETLARLLIGIVNLRLCKRADGCGRVLASEVLLQGPGLSAALREGSAAALLGYIAGGRHLGMRTLTESLSDHLASSAIHSNEAWSQAQDKWRFAHPLLRVPGRLVG